MNIIIIEDEKPAAEKLRKLILKYDPAMEIIATLGSVESATAWLKENPTPDLIFMDIELSDGLSFKIFERQDIPCPIIFTTAFDEYWQEALEQNSIDYLLKPIRQEKLENAINKYKKLKTHFSGNYTGLLNMQSPWQTTSEYRKRFLIKKGTDLVSVKAEDIAYAFAAHKLVFIVNSKAQRFILDKSLNDLEKELDPALFFRVNRKYLVNQQHIHKIKSTGKSKLLLELNPPAAEEVVISQESSAAFKQWMDT